MHHNFSLIPVFSGIINLLLALFVVSINPKRRLNQVFLGLGLCLAGWNFGAASLAHVHDPDIAAFRIRLMLVAVIFLPAFFYRFAVEVADRHPSRWQAWTPFVIALVLVGLSLTSWFMPSVRPYTEFYRPVPGWAFWIFYCGALPLSAIGVARNLTRFIRQAPATSVRSAGILVSAIALLYVGGAHDLLLFAGFDRYPWTNARILPWGCLTASVYGLLIAYSILSNQLLDVRVSINRNAAKVLRFGFLTGIAYVLLLSVGVFFPSTFTFNGLIASLVILIVSVSVTGTFFPKLLGGLAGQLEQGVLGDHFEYQDKILAFMDGARDAEHVQSLLDQAVDLVFDQLSLTAIGIAIVSGDAKTRGQSARSTRERRTWTAIFSPDSTVLAFFRSTGSSTLDLRDSFRPSAVERAARAVLKSESLDLAFAIGSRPNAPVGVLVLGPRRDGRALTLLDRDVLRKLGRNVLVQVERIAVNQNEELRQANKAKDQFLASINHEIRNPLNGITGIVQMLQAQSPDARSRFLLSTLQACTDQLRSTMDDVLDFTHIDSDSITITLGTADLVELVKTTCASYDLSGDRLVVTEVPIAPVFVRCDAGKIRQILSNYLGNALKYGVPAGATVTLATSPADASGRTRIALTVTSTGPTLSTEEIASLFKPLTRGRRARETNAHGTGLGLALCRKLAQAMQGGVGVRSDSGQTSFWFEATLALAHAVPATAEATFASAFRGCRALVIEDEPYNRLVMGHYLAQLGITASWADNGRATLAAISEQSFDVILMDWLLPDMDGAELLPQLRQHLNASLPPVVVVSAYSTTSKRAECLAAGAAAFVSKPIDRAKLVAALTGCALSRAAIPHETATVASAAIDLSALFALDRSADVIDRLVREIGDGQARLHSIWRNDPAAAALLAHRLKSQMALVNAKDCASLLELFERGFTENWSAGNLEPLAGNVFAEISTVCDEIQRRARSHRSAAARATC